MQPLREQLGTGDKRRKVVEDACLVLDQEVADKSGLTGIAIKTAYKVVKGIRPGFIPEVVDSLLDEFLDAHFNAIMCPAIGIALKPPRSDEDAVRWFYRAYEVVHREIGFTPGRTVALLATLLAAENGPPPVGIGHCDPAPSASRRIFRYM